MIAATMAGWRGALLGACLCIASGLAAGAGLQVSPISLTLAPTQNADGLWLSNVGDDVLHAQVRVYRWTQDGGEDQLTTSRELIVSPPMLQLAAGGRQLVRVIRLGVPPADGAEQAYRVLIDELPIESEDRKGVQFVLRHSLPIFVTPAGSAPSAPRLHWKLRHDGAQSVLEVSNSGGTHAQVADLTFTDAAGLRTTVAAGLLGYALPGARMRWAVKTPAVTTGGRWEAMINGTTAPQDITPIDDPAR